MEILKLIGLKGDRKGTAGEPSELQLPVEVDFQGPKKVADGKKPIIDIVAVHGLNGHRDKTWTAANKVHWLRDLLPTDIPNARIWCWGYDANTHGDQVSCQYLYDHAQSLVSELYLERKNTKTTESPIIFVAHSLGGIIVKSALIHSDAARKGAMEQHRSIKTSTYGIIFMGTPHQGSGNVQIGKLLLNIAQLFVTTNGRLIKNLEEHSEWLQQQLRQYGPISGEFVTKFAYEEYKTRTKMGHSIMVVPRESAVVPGAADTEAIVIHADHVNMVKFLSKENNGYRTVSGHLRIMAEEACNVIATRWEEEERINSARDNSGEKFSLVFSLSECIQTNNFVARQEELAEIHETLGSGTGRRTVILHGLGGIGKTQLAIEYAKLHRGDYSAVLWLNIKDKDSVRKSYAEIFERVRKDHPLASQLVSIKYDSPRDDIVTAVKQWLDHAENTRWLMVFDNYDNPKVPDNTDPGVVNINEFLPKAYHGSVIITTRVSKVNIGHQIEIRKLGNIYDSLRILSDASHRKGVMEDPKAEELAKELDGLPLALATAGAFLNEVTFSFAEYLDAYRTSWLELQKTSPQVTSYEDRQLYSTWQLSFDHIKRQNEPAAQLLELWAYFDNEDLWFELLKELGSFARGPEFEWLRRLTKNNLTFTQAIRLIRNYGLAGLDRIGDLEAIGYSIHSCVHSWTIHVLNEKWDSYTAGLVLECIGLQIPDEDSHMLIRERHQLHRIARHAARCGGFVSDDKVEGEGREWAMHELGNVFRDAGKLDDAETMYQRALQGREKAPGPDDESTLATTSNLGNLYVRLKRFGEAEERLKRALEGQEKLFGPNHKSILKTIKNLGFLYEEWKQLEEAEKWYERAAQGYKKAQGNNKYNSEREKMFDKVDHIRKQLGKETEKEREEAERKRRKAAKKRERKARKQSERQSERQELED